MNRQARHLLTLTALFTLSRAVIYPLRPFYYAPIHFYMQYLDPEVLRNNLLETLWHLHSQPPLFNLFLGLVLKISPDGQAPHLFAAVYFVFSLGTVLLLYAILRRLGVRGWLAVTGAMVYALLPSTIQAERWLFYACPVTFLLTASVYALGRFAETKQTVWFAVLAGLGSITVLTRSFFHLVFWLLPLLVGALYAGGWRNAGWDRAGHSPAARRNGGSQGRKLVLHGAMALVALALAAVPYALNAARYGMFTASTWQGMSLAKMTRYVAPESIESMIVEGRVTGLARIPCFAEPAVYVSYYGGVPETGIEALDQLEKSTHEPNWNHIVYVRASREYQRNAWTIINRHPGAYAKAVLNEMYLFFGLRSHVYLEDLHAWIFGEHFVSRRFFREGMILFVAPVLYLLLFIGALTGWLRCLAMTARRQVGPDSVRDHPGAAVSAYALFLLLYTFGLASLVELGEGGYMRMPIEPLLVAGCVLKFGCPSRQRITSKE